MTGVGAQGELLEGELQAHPWVTCKTQLRTQMFTMLIFVQPRSYQVLSVILNAFVLTCTAALVSSADAITKTPIAARCLPAVFILGSCDMTQARQKEKKNSLCNIFTDG